MAEPALSKPGCECCMAAETNHQHGGYRADCLECSCRALAHSPDAWRAIQALSNEPLRAAILSLSVQHETMASRIKARVWFWIGRFNKTKEPS